MVSWSQDNNQEDDAEDDMDTKTQHISVMYREVQECMKFPPNGCFVDCTLGLGGHSRLLAKKLGARGHLVGIDRDKKSIKLAKENLQGVAPKCSFVHDNYRNIDKILKNLNIKNVNGILFDLGLSSFQLDSAERGFSFNLDGPLDMRMDQDSCLCASDLINTLSEQKIIKILHDFGEERFAKRIARLIVDRRTRQPFQTTKELREAILKAIPRQEKRQKLHPATRTFQAIRIAVNRELESIKLALEKSVDFLSPGSRICVISFHSLEDRIVKQQFRTFEEAGIMKLIMKKPLCPQNDEMEINHRSRSAKLRVAEKI